MPPKKSRAGKKTPPKKAKKKSSTKKAVHHSHPHTHPALTPDSPRVANIGTTPLFSSPSMQPQVRPPLSQSSAFSPPPPFPSPAPFPQASPPPLDSSVPSPSIASTPSTPPSSPSSSAPSSTTPVSPPSAASPSPSTAASEPPAPSLPAFSPGGGGGQRLPYATETFGVHTSQAAVHSITPLTPTSLSSSPSGGTTSTLPYGLPPLSAATHPSSLGTKAPKRSVWSGILLLSGLLFFLSVIVFGGIRLLPCNRQAQASNWTFWSIVAPNFICTLDLSKSSDIDVATLQSRLGSFTKATEMNLSFMQLSEIPPVFDSLPQLRTLHLEGNALRSLPANMTALIHLTTLDLSHNPLGSLPPLVTALKNLETLSLADTGISTLPAGMSNLSSLRVLDLSDNHLSVIPATVNALPTLQTLYFSGNAIPAVKQKELRKNMPNITIIFDKSPSVPPPASSHASTSNTSPQQASNGGAADTCHQRFSINGFGICLPNAWHVARDTKNLDATIVDDFGKPIATVTCPMSQDGYEDWHTTTVSRTYKKDNIVRGVDLLTGTKGQTGTPQKRLSLLLHLHSLNGWYGDGYKDVSASCQMDSLHPERDAVLFQTMYDTVF